LVTTWLENDASIPMSPPICIAVPTPELNSIKGAKNPATNPETVPLIPPTAAARQKLGSRRKHAMGWPRCCSA
jgi:hypothetical protein